MFLLALQIVAADTVALRQLAEFYQQPTGDSLACAFLSRDDSVWVLDSTRLALTCSAPANGVIGFLREPEEEAVVLNAMRFVLERRPDLVFAGVVYGVVPLYYNSAWRKAPRVWAAVRP